MIGVISTHELQVFMQLGTREFISQGFGLQWLRAVRSGGSAKHVSRRRRVVRTPQSPERMKK